METLVQKANRLMALAKQNGRCSQQAKEVKRKLEDLKDEAGVSGGQIIGAGIAAVGVVVAFFTFGTGTGFVIAGLTVLAVTTDAKLTRLKKAKKELERAVEDLEECLS
jgi:hypothetical protein